MSTSAMGAVIDSLVTTARAALPSTQVYDGYGSSDDPGDFLMIGVEDPDSITDAPSADAQQTWAHANGQARNEEGQITCAALSWNGNGDQAAARAAVFTICAALENALRANPSLGLPTVLWTGFGTTQQLTQRQSDAGALALVVFRIAYRARI